MPFSFTLWVSPVKDGEGDGTMHLMLAGDDDGVEEALLSRRIQRIGQRDGRTEVLGLRCQTNFLHTSID